MIKFKIFFPLIIILLMIEILFYKIFKKRNSKFAYYSMINLFCISGGWSNDLINFFLKKKLFPDRMVSNPEYDNKGYILNKKYLNKEEIHDLKIDLKSINGYWSGDNYKSKNKEKLDINIKSTKYFYEQNDLIKSKIVQELIQRKDILDLARKCLKCEPILYNINCWYSFPNSRPDITAAQKWHFDMDRPRWVKFFFYLTDCNENQGPHCFIQGSHKNNGIPKKIRELGYKRIEDDHVSKFFNKSDILEFNCSEGDLLIEDTRGLHKGKSLISGNRLIFQFEFASSLFGGSYRDISVSEKFCSNEFKQNIIFNKYIYQAIKII